MGVMIKGMKMPTSCDNCPFKTYVGSDRLECKITGYRFYAWDVGWGDKTYTRHESCPLIAVPSHDCNDCGRNVCEYIPAPGQLTRINCPMWEPLWSQEEDE